jgi:GGDEF domain-containing protein
MNGNEASMRSTILPSPAASPRAASRSLAAEPEVLRQNCLAALRSMGEYAPEIEPGDGHSLGAELQRLAPVLADTFSAAEARRVRVGIRGALRRYQQLAHGRIGQMRYKVEAAQTAIREFAAGHAAGNAVHCGGVQHEIDALRAAAKSSDLVRLRGALEKACEGLRCSHGEFVREQQLVMLQLQDEIRTLREALEAHQRERRRDLDSGAVPRETLDAEIRARLSRQELFSVLLLSIHNLERLEAEHSRPVIHGLLDAFFRRLAGIVSDDVIIATWDRSAFALLLPATGARAEQLRDAVCGRLPGVYAVQAGGTSRRLLLDLTVRILDPAAEFCAHP